MSKPKEFWIEYNLSGDLRCVHKKLEAPIYKDNDLIHVREVLPSCVACNEEFDCNVCGYSTITDSMRLEWMIENRALVGIDGIYWGVEWAMFRNSTPFIYNSPHEAIDAAMKDLK